MEVIKIISVLLTISYVVFIVYYLVGWLKIGYWTDYNISGKIKVSIIVPARNEEQNIVNCLTAIANQDYPQALVEVIVVDDFSTDSTPNLVERFEFPHIKLIKLNEVINKAQPRYAYKKKAIEVGIQNANGNLIVTTDADCIMERKWLSSIVSYYEKNDVRLISGPVAFRFKPTFFEIFQALDFAALVGMGGGAIGHNAALICNGANLTYEKKAFVAVNGYQGVDNIASGDDVLLLHKIASHYPGQIGFVKSKDAIVNTYPSKTISEFINQRKRWISKTTSYKDQKIILLLSMVYLFNLLIVVNLIIAIFYPEILPFALIQLGCKIALDALFINAATDFSKQRRILWLFLPVQLVHIFYVIIIGLIGFTGSYKWKERVVK